MNTKHLTHCPAFSRHLVAFLVIVRISKLRLVKSYCIESLYGIFMECNIGLFSVIVFMR